MTRPSKAFLITLVAAVLLGQPAQGAPFKYTDRRGDTLDGRASLDIVSVSHDVRQMNKSGPPSLVFELELAAPPERQLASYFIMSEAEGCGSFYASFRPGSLVFGNAGIAPADFYSECSPDGDGMIVPAQFRIDGKVLRWAVALDSVGKEMKGSGTLSSLRAFTQIAEPATGIIGTGWLDGTEAPFPMDEAESDKSFKY